MSWQLYCRDVCKFLLWSVEYILKQSTANFGRISNSIEILVVGRVPCRGIGYSEDIYTGHDVQNINSLWPSDSI